MIRSRKPQMPGGEKQVAHWSRAKMPVTSKMRGWKAGPVCGTFIHFVHRQSVPCLDMMSEGVLACPHCQLAQQWEWKGYLPFYDEDYARRFVIISAPIFEAVEEIPHLAMIEVQRGKNDKDPVLVRPNNWRTTPLPHSAERAEQVDLMRFLVQVLWKSTELMRFASGAIAQQTITLDTPQDTSDPSGLKDKIAGGGRGTMLDYVGLALGDKSEQVNRVARNEQYAKAAKNGHHKKPKPEES